MILDQRNYVDNLMKIKSPSLPLTTYKKKF